MRARRVVVAVLVTALGLTTGPAAVAAPRKKADLKVAATQTLAFTGAAGTAVRTRATIKNVGTKRAGASAAGLYLSRRVTPQAGDRRLARSATPALDPGRQARPVLAGVLPATLAVGTWRLLVCTDVAGQVPERTSTNNCAVWRTFTVKAPGTPPDPPVAQGPIGGATSSCGGTYRPFVTGPGTQPPGVHLSVTGPVVDEVVVTHQADAVGFEARDGDDEYRHTVVTLVNDGTAATSGLVVDAVSCEYDRTDPDYWAVVDDDEFADVPGTRCGPVLQPGASCQISIFARDITRGGDRKPGAVRVFGNVAGEATAMWATFPIVATSTSRGYLQLDAIAGDPTNGVAPGTARYTIYRATNVGDRAAVPTFAIDEDPGTPEGIFSQGGPSWTPLDGGTTCETRHDPGPPPVTSGAIPPGGSCQFRVRACTTLSTTTYGATLHARDAYRASLETYSFPLELRYSTTATGAGTCDD